VIGSLAAIQPCNYRDMVRRPPPVAGVAHHLDALKTMREMRRHPDVVEPAAAV